MSSLIGSPTDRWSLTRAADALGEAARQSRRPSWAWFVGVFYPSVTLGVTSTWRLSQPGTEATLGPLSADVFFRPAIGSSMLASELLLSALWTTLLVFLFFPVSRLVAGLARVSTNAAWSSASAGRSAPRLSTLWRNGAGMTLSVIGLWVQFIVMVIGMLLAILLPAESVARPLLQGADRVNGTHFVTIGLWMGPVVLLCASYLLAISVLTQLALHSLAHNRRGVGSALLHAWRIMQHDPWATVRAVVVDLVLSLAILTLTGITAMMFHEWISTAALLLFSGYAGCTRSAYWARAYRALGGLSPDDGVPGLPVVTT